MLMPPQEPEGPQKADAIAIEAGQERDKEESLWVWDATCSELLGCNFEC